MLQNPTVSGADPDFLAGGGEMGGRMRSLDWSKTPLGPAEGWPQSLKTIVRVMLDSRYAMWMLWGPELTFFCNDAYLPTVGMKRDWVLGARSDKVWEEIWPDIGPRIQRVLEEGRATWDEGLLLFLERNGFPEETYHTFSYSPIYNDVSQIAGMLCVVTEVTDRVIGERRLRVLRDLASSPRAESPADACKRLIDVLSHSPLEVAFAALYLLQPAEQSFVLTNHFGKLPESLRPERLPPGNGTGQWPPGSTSLGGAPELIELQDDARSFSAPLWPDRVSRALALPIPPGAAHSTALLLVGLSPRRPFDDGYRGFFDLLARQFTSAISDAQAYEAERARSEALAELDRAKTAFFSNVSHEFRTPLTLLLGPLEEAIQHPHEGLRGDALLSAHRNALRLLRLVNTLLDFSRIEAGRAQAHFVATDIAAVTSELASFFQTAMERASLRFTVQCQPLPEPVFVDREMWEKIVLNLLSNAFKFTLAGEVRLELAATAEGALLVVADTGTGIPAEALPRLFDRFYRVPGASGRTHEGSGIGLALVRELVQLHGGSIEVESVAGEGSTFRVRMPFGAAHLPASQVEDRAAAATTPGNALAIVEEAQRWLPDKPASDDSALVQMLSQSEATYADSVDAAAGDRPAILLVDDNRDMREHLTRLLSPRFDVTTAEDGAAALRLLDAGLKPELVLSDVMMPRLDGFGLLKALRERTLTATLPVIFLSARAGEEARIEGFDVGADDYLIKPFSTRELITRVRTHIRLSRVRGAAERVLREADQRKDIFLATLAHELRNPLAPIRNAAQVLAAPNLRPEKLEWAQTVIQRQVRHMAWLLDDLMDVARITQGKVELRRQQITLSSVVESALEASRPLFDRKKHQLVLALPAEQVYLDADPVRLSQVLANLLTNAAKYTDTGGRIALSGRVENGVLTLAVKDNGIGISPQALPRVFEMFSQAEDALTRSEGGLGIGLALVKGLVELHGGGVEARSSGPGAGSEFIVHLPIAPAAAAAPSAGHGSSAQQTGKRILVADDNRDAAESLALLLEMAGHDVRIAHDGRAALELAASFRPDWALLDIGMPQLNGYEVAAALRKQSWGADIHLIALTGWGQDGDRQRAVAAGFDRHLTKPVDPDVLLALI